MSVIFICSPSSSAGAGRRYASSPWIIASTACSTLIEPISTPCRAGRTTSSRQWSHAFALRAPDGDGHAAAKRLRRANLLTSAIGLPDDAAAGVRLGTNEAVRWGIGVDAMPELSDLVTRAWSGDGDPRALAADVTTFRGRFTDLRYCAS
jgi:glycine hydroxymethyltransferase